MTDNPPVLPMNFSQLARQIAMDILPLRDILDHHQLTEDDWEEVQHNTNFQTILNDMVREWNAVGNTKTRVRLMAATGVEALLEPTIQACADPTVPLSQKIDGLKFLAKLGELIDAPEMGGGTAADRVQINIYTGTPESSVVIDATPVSQEIADA